MNESNEETKKCPFCAETIKKEAIICRFCGSNLVDEKNKNVNLPSVNPEPVKEVRTKISIMDGFNIGCGIFLSILFITVVIIILLSGMCAHILESTYKPSDIKKEEQSTNIDSCYSHNVKGINYLDNSDYDSAIKEFNKAIEINPFDATAYNNRGLAYGDKGDHNRAIEDLNKAINYDPNLHTAYYNRGTEYIAICDYDKAINDFSQAIIIKPNYAKAFCNRGVAYFNKGSYDSAIEDFNKAIEINPLDTLAYHIRGLAYQKRGEFDLALKDYNQAINLSLNNDGAYFHRGNLYSDKGEYDLAIKDYDKAISICQDPDAYNNRYDQAIKYFANVYNNRGYVYSLKGNYDKAIKDYTKAIELNPKQKIAFVNRGWELFIKGYYDSALLDFDKAISVDIEYSLPYNNKGLVYFVRGDEVKAYEYLNKATLLSKNTKEKSMSLGYITLIHLKNEELDKALSVIESISQNEEVDTNYYFFKAISEYESGKNDIAKASYQKWINLRTIEDEKVLKRILPIKFQSYLDKFPL